TWLVHSATVATRSGEGRPCRRPAGSSPAATSTRRATPRWRSPRAWRWRRSCRRGRAARRRAGGRRGHRWRPGGGWGWNCSSPGANLCPFRREPWRAFRALAKARGGTASPGPAAPSFPFARFSIRIRAAQGNRTDASPGVAVMPTTALATFVETLRDQRLLDPAQLDQVADTLAESCGTADALTAELRRRGWLTDYQAEQLRKGEGKSLAIGQYLLIDRLGEGGMGE